jgi:hypothetical protein
MCLHGGRLLLSVISRILTHVHVIHIAVDVVIPEYAQGWGYMGVLSHLTHIILMMVCW